VHPGYIHPLCHKIVIRLNHNQICMQEGEAQQLEKEFGDAGDDADIVDEKMWQDEGADGAGDDGEDGEDAPRKDAGACARLLFH
jgi:hypothetical protein